MPRDLEELMPKRPAYFWWLLVNLLALCFAILSWIFCLEVFGNPEIPRNYSILRKIGRLPVIQSFKLNELPDGDLCNPEKLWKFYGLNDEQMKRLNHELLRNYVTNFDSSVAVTYISGDYQVLELRRLGEEDFLLDGFAVKTRAMVKPDDLSPPREYPVVVEFLFPSSDAFAAEQIKLGDLITISKRPHGLTVLNVAKTFLGDEPVLSVTAIPIVHGACVIGHGNPLKLRVPTEVRPSASFPVFR